MQLIYEIAFTFLPVTNSIVPPEFKSMNPLMVKQPLSNGNHLLS